jgi:outer membrane protein TolC
MFASIIATSAGSFGIPIPKVGLKQLLCNSYDKALLASNLRQEVATIIATNESYAQQLVVEKCSQLQLAYQRHQLQLQRVSSWEHRLQQIEKLQSQGEARPGERAIAESGLLKARSDEAVRRLEAKLAEVSLAEVVGGLAGKCCRGEAWFPTP